MKRLTDIVWPAIGAAVRARIDELRASPAPPPAVVIEAAVLLEAGATTIRALVERIWVVHTPPPVAIARLCARNSLTEAEAQKRLDSQMSNAERLQHAHVAIDNSGDALALEARVREAWTAEVAAHR